MDTSDNLLTNPDFSDKVQYNFQLQICRNITKPMDPMACNVTSPAYMVCLLHVVFHVFFASLLHVVCVGGTRNETYLSLLQERIRTGG